MAKITFTTEQIKAFEKKAQQYDSKEELLVGIGAIKIRDGNWVIMQVPGLVGKRDPITGAEFTNDFPYTLYSNLVEELEKKDKRKKYAEKMNAKSLEETAKELDSINNKDKF